MGRTGRLRAGVAGALGLVLLGACVPGGEGPPPATYAALGDSFSSGQGAGAYDAAPADCDRSAFAWPRLLDPSVDLRACSGADTADLLEQLPPQPDEDVTLVTLTLGGNDAGFGDLFEACLLGACPSPTSPDVAARLASMQDALVSSVHPALRTAYPNARIVHVGYPRLTPPPGDPVAVGCFWLPPEDQANAAALVDHVNDAIRSATEGPGSGVEFLDVSDALADHELCTAHPWVTLLGRAHPTLPGQHALRAAVAADL